MPTRMIADSSIKYVRMSKRDNEDYIDLQFKTRPPKVPWKSIIVAIIMFIMGSALLIVGALLVSGHIDTKYSDRFWPVIFLGVILFVPGFYHVRLALYAYKGYAGYSFDDIPDYDD
ncbi:transmembrane protein 230-like [Amphiura filiformis]|uniref:transmembrane protein 230-like n=1 Tax=Amphiura filiformis TaxID=82378 RepID=UPI003B218488